MFTLVLFAAITAAAPIEATPRAPLVAPESMRVAVVRDSAAEALDRARRAECAGNFETARQEYAAAAALGKAAGGLAIEASYGLAHVLQQQSLLRDAGLVLNHLASEAALRGDAETEAQALLDAMWLNAAAREHVQVHADVARLKALLTDEAVSTVTRRQIRARLA